MTILRQKLEKEYNFDYDKELAIYKNVACIKLKRKNRKYIKEYNKWAKKIGGKEVTLEDGYCEWEENIEKKYENYEEAKIKNLLFYLDRAIAGKKHYVNVKNIAILPILASIMGFATGKIIDLKDTTGDVAGFLAYIVTVIILLLLLFCFYIWRVDAIFRKDETEENFVTQYKKVIENLYNRKYNK